LLVVFWLRWRLLLLLLCSFCLKTVLFLPRRLELPAKSNHFVPGCGCIPHSGVSLSPKRGIFSLQGFYRLVHLVSKSFKLELTIERGVLAAGC